ncbi:MAG: class I SAM-dependent methyltransferase, partial [Candidatus Margulisbacteria bacterium]|nr:class I SAM-dependent methyltransferase [Candidatus Margulisiibacteriota bacterium]
MDKSTVEEIRERFDKDVARFANIDTGQTSTIDAKISLEIITDAAKIMVPGAVNLLDIGCGAGNYTLMMLAKIANLNCTLVDLSRPMLNKAFERVSKQTKKIKLIQGDIRTVELNENYFDIILAGAVLHHLRDDADWERTFKKLYNLLTDGGCLLVSDLITQDNKLLAEYIWKKYADYLENSGGQEYSKKVLDYVSR